MNKKEQLNQGLMLLDSNEVESYLSLEETIDTVEFAYTQYYKQKAMVPPVVNVMLDDREGELDVKTGYLPGFEMIGVKIASGFYRNAINFGIPSWSSVIILADAETGFPVAVLDGSYVTTVRTGVAGAVGAKYLARPESETLFILGAGNQARIQLLAITKVMNNIKKVFVYSPIKEEVDNYVKEMSEKVEISIAGIYEKSDIASAVNQADIIITVTPSKSPQIFREWIKEGTHINAIGADAPGKQELDPKILRDAKVVADSIRQVRVIGECQHAIKAGYIDKECSNIWAEIGALTSGEKRGRENNKEITVFDATGIAVLDVAAGCVIYNKALKNGKTRYFKMSELK